MEAKAIARYVRIAPRKLRIVIDLIRGKAVGEAFAILKHTPKVGSEVIEKVLRSAVANAEHNYDMNVDNLIVSSCFIDQGPTMKRIHPRSRGARGAQRSPRRRCRMGCASHGCRFCGTRWYAPARDRLTTRAWQFQRRRLCVEAAPLAYLRPAQPRIRHACKRTVSGETPSFWVPVHAVTR